MTLRNAWGLGRQLIGKQVVVNPACSDFDIYTKDGVTDADRFTVTDTHFCHTEKSSTGEWHGVTARCERTGAEISGSAWRFALDEVA